MVREKYCEKCGKNQPIRRGYTKAGKNKHFCKNCGKEII
jgi:hypothetical protein